MSDRVEAFFAAWSMPDPAARRAAIAGAMAASFSYADPRTPEPVTDVDALTDYVGMFIQAAPGATVEISKTDTLHGATRATITFRMADGMAQTGQYFIEHDALGQITRMVGFVGTGAPA